MKRNIMCLVLAGTLALTPLAGCTAQQSDSNSAAATSSQTSGSSNSTTSAAQFKDEKFVLYLGTNDKDTNKPVFTPEEANEKAKEILIKHFGVYTIQDAEGGWVDDDGTISQEYTLIIHLSDTTLDKVHEAADELVEVFRQSSVLIDTSLVATEFYSGKNS